MCVEFVIVFVFGGLMLLLVMFEFVVDVVGVDGFEVYVLVCLWVGGFYYDVDEFVVVECDVCYVIVGGVLGVVIGVLDVDGCLDVLVMVWLWDVVGGVFVILYCVIDVMVDLVVML